MLPAVFVFLRAELCDALEPEVMSGQKTDSEVRFFDQGRDAARPYRLKDAHKIIRCLEHKLHRLQ